VYRLLHLIINQYRINHIQGEHMTKRPSTYLNKPHNQIAKCIREQSITGLLWAYIQLAQSEIKQEGTSVTFSGSDLSKFVTLLHTREIESVLNQPEPQDIAAIASWLETTETKPKQ